MTKFKVDPLKAALVILVIGTIIPAVDPWFSGWKYFFFGSCIYYSIYMAKIFSVPIGAAVGWTLYSGIRVFTDKEMYSSLGGEVARSMDTVALKAVLVFVLLTMLMQASKKHLDYLEDLFASICIADALWVIIEVCFGFRPGGFLGNPSINGTFIAMSYPLLAMREERNLYDALPLGEAYKKHTLRMVWDLVCFLAPIIAVFLSDSSIPVGVLITVMVMYILLNGGDIKGVNTLKKKIILAAHIAVGFLIIAQWKISALFNTTGRWAIWELATKWLFEKDGQWTGTGLGTFFIWGPHLQHASNLGVGNWWIWMHNDPLQTIFETGIIGFIIYTWAFLFTFIKALNSKQHALAICLFGFAAGSCFNFPSHIALTAFFGTWLVAKIHMDEVGE